jgi:hypothetical protein
VNNGGISSAEEQELKKYNGLIDDEEFDATAEQKLTAIEQVTNYKYIISLTFLI